MSNNPQSRKWVFVVNNPQEKGIDDLYLKNMFEEYKITWLVKNDEIGEEGTKHIQGFFYSENPKAFLTVQNMFNGKAHLEIAHGKCKDNLDYVRKEGKHANKKDTQIPDTFLELGEMPIEKQGQRNDLTDLYDMIKQGKSNYEILEDNQSYLLHLDKINNVRQALLKEKFKNVWRKLEVTYICGSAGVGKTRYVMEKYGYDNVYRVTDYMHPFDLYESQDVILFDEFRESIPISKMLVYLDGYPVELPARYGNRIACYTKVYIISNIPINKQYINIQDNEPETYKALLRRITEVKSMWKNEEFQQINIDFDKLK